MKYYNYLLACIFGFQLVFLSWKSSGQDISEFLSAQIEKMENENAVLQHGYTEQTGWYVIAFGTAAESNNNKKTAFEIALLHAKKEIASFLGESISTTSKYGISEETTNENSEISEFYKSIAGADVEESLCGISIYKTKEKDETFQVICYVTEKTLNLVKSFRDEKDELGQDFVKALGISPIIKDRVDIAKKNAINSALRSAVEQVIGTEVLANTKVQNDEQLRSRVFAFTAGFIEEYRIKNENVSEGNYVISIIAKVQKEKLHSSYKNMLRSMGDPSFYISYDNEDIYPIIVEFFNDLGFSITTEINSADYFVDISSKFREIDSPKLRMDGTQLSLWLKISDAINRRELLSIRNQPGKATVFKLTPERRMEKAIEMAFEQIKPELHKKLNKLIGGMASSGRPVKIMIEGYEDSYAGIVKQICSTVEMIPGTHNVNRKIDPRTGDVIINLDFQGLIDDLEFFLRAGMKENLSEETSIPITKGIETNILTLKF